MNDPILAWNINTGKELTKDELAAHAAQVATEQIAAANVLTQAKEFVKSQCGADYDAHAAEIDQLLAQTQQAGVLNTEAVQMIVQGVRGAADSLQRRDAAMKEHYVPATLDRLPAPYQRKLVNLGTTDETAIEVAQKMWPNLTREQCRDRLVKNAQEMAASGEFDEARPRGFDK